MRKIVSAGFYKEKLAKMILMMKDESVKQIQRWRALAESDQSGSCIVDLRSGLGEVFTRTILRAALGADLYEAKMDFYENGTKKTIAMPQLFENVFTKLLLRPSNPLRSLFPILN
jgi:hypothetical protein